MGLSRIQPGRLVVGLFFLSGSATIGGVFATAGVPGTRGANVMGVRAVAMELRIPGISSSASVLRIRAVTVATELRV